MSRVWNVARGCATRDRRWFLEMFKYGRLQVSGASGLSGFCNFVSLGSKTRNGYRGFCLSYLPGLLRCLFPRFYFARLILLGIYEIRGSRLENSADIDRSKGLDESSDVNWIKNFSSNFRSRSTEGSMWTCRLFSIRTEDSLNCCSGKETGNSGDCCFTQKYRQWYI